MNTTDHGSEKDAVTVPVELFTFMSHPRARHVLRGTRSTRRPERAYGRLVIGGALALVLALGCDASAAANPLKASRACRRTSAQQLMKLVRTALKLVDTCHRERDKGKLARDCNDLAAVDVKGRIAKARARAESALAKKCAPADPVRTHFFAGAIAPALVAMARAGVEGSALVLQGLPDLAGAKAPGKCHRALAKARSAIVAEILRATAKCQKRVDKHATDFGAVDAACVATAVKQGPKAAKAITKACAGLVGPDVGSCAGLPQCLVEHATATGQTLATAMFAQPARPFDGRVAATLDDARAATASLGPDGGTVTATDADGTQYTLVVPAGALLVDTPITLTPVAAIDDLPLTGGLVAAVQFAPEGLQLYVPATLTIELAAAVDPAGLVGFGYAGSGAGLHLDLVGATGSTLVLSVTHFSGVGAAVAVPADYDALLALPTSAASAGALAAFGQLFDAGVSEPGPYAAALAAWYDGAVGPALAAAGASDAALLAALGEYVLWWDVIERADILNGTFDLQQLLGVNGFALANRRDAAEPFLVAGLKGAIARAGADCLAQQSLARAADALAWQGAAAALGLATVAHQLDQDSVLADFCLEVLYESTSFPAMPQAGVAAPLDLVIGTAFSGGPTFFDQPILVDVQAEGVDEFAAFGLTDAQGGFSTTFTPTGAEAVQLTIGACLATPAYPRLSAVCQTALVIRGELTVTPAAVTLSAGDGQQFSAALLGLPTVQVTWNATGGTIDANGLFTAGTAAGMFTVTATAGGTTGSATIEIVPAPVAADVFPASRLSRAQGHKLTLMTYDQDFAPSPSTLDLPEETRTVDDGGAVTIAAREYSTFALDGAGRITAATVTGTVSFTAIEGGSAVPVSGNPFADLEVAFDVTDDAVQVDVTGTLGVSSSGTCQGDPGGSRCHGALPQYFFTPSIGCADAALAHPGASTGDKEVECAAVVGPGHYVFRAEAKAAGSADGELAMAASYDLTLTFSPVE